MLLILTVATGEQSLFLTGPEDTYPVETSKQFNEGTIVVLIPDVLPHSKSRMHEFLPF